MLFQNEYPHVMLLCIPIGGLLDYKAGILSDTTPTVGAGCCYVMRQNEHLTYAGDSLFNN